MTPPAGETEASERHRVLLIEDHERLARTYKGFLRGTGFELVHAGDLKTGAEYLNAHRPDAIMLDVHLPDGDGVAWLHDLRERGDATPVVVITAHGTQDLAHAALTAGAEDFLDKPFSGERLRVTLRNLMARSRAERNLEAMRAAVGRQRLGPIIGASPPMQVVYKVIESAASSKATVFITGESGTGKELAARAVHDLSPRKTGPFIAVNCGAIPEDLIESELFGHVKGAFTGALQDRPGAARSADGGTLFLDEICEMELSLQTKLLRFLQTGEVTPVGSSKPVPIDTRILCATNRHPMAEVRQGRFREDLYYRLYVVPLQLPPLRERGEDVLAIAQTLFARAADQEGKPFDGLTPAAERALSRYDWPGNIRELENVVRKTVVMTPGGTIDADMLELGDVSAPLVEDAAPVAKPISDLEQLARRILADGRHRARSH